MNEGPAGGVLLVNTGAANAAAVSTVTEVTFSTSGWTDSDQPLTYQFYRRTTFGDVVDLNLPSDLTTFSTKALPFGDAANQYNLVVGVRATDYLGVSSTREATIRVTPRPAGTKSTADSAKLFDTAQKQLSSKTKTTFCSSEIMTVECFMSFATTLATNMCSEESIANANIDVAGATALKADMLNVVRQFSETYDITASSAIQLVSELTKPCAKRTINDAVASAAFNLLQYLFTSGKLKDEVTASSESTGAISAILGIVKNLIVMDNIGASTAEKALSILSDLFTFMATNFFQEPSGNEKPFKLNYDNSLSSVLIRVSTAKDFTYTVQTQDSNKRSVAVNVAISREAFAADPSNYADIRLVEIVPHPIRMAGQLASAGVSLEAVNSQGKVMSFSGPDTVTVTIPYNTGSCRAASLCVPECVLWNLASQSWTTAGVKTGLKVEGSSTIECHPSQSASLMGVRISAIGNFPTASSNDASSIRVRMENPSTALPDDIGTHMSDAAFEMALATGSDVAQFHMIAVLAASATSTYTYFDISASSNVSPLTILLSLQEQSGATVSALHDSANSVTVDTNADSFKRLCADETYQLSCLGGEKSSGSDDDNTVILAAVLGSGGGIMAVAGAIFLAKKKKEGSSTSNEKVAAPTALKGSKPASEPVTSADPGATAAPGDSSV